MGIFVLIFLLNFLALGFIKITWLKILYFNIIVVIFLLVYIETIYGVVFPDHIIKDPYSIKKNFYFNKPYLDEKFIDREYTTHYITNSQGFRIGESNDPDVTVAKTDWLFIGDSFTQGAQVEFEELFTSLVYLKHPDKVLVNAGISGMGLIDEYNYYKEEGYKLKASKVFLQICNFNDFMHVRPNTISFSEILMHYSNFFRLILYPIKYKHSDDLPLGRWTEPFYKDEDFNRDYNIFYKEQSEYKQKDLENFKKYMKLFSDIARKNGSELIIILIPTKEQIYPRFYSEVIDSFHINEKLLDMRFPNKLMREISDKLNIKLIDLSEDFKRNDECVFFEIDEHLNTTGHQAIADSLNRFLEKENQHSISNKLSKLNSGDRYPLQMSDGTQISFQTFRDGSLEIFTSDNELNNLKRYYSNFQEEIHPMFSPDKQLIVFTQGKQETFNTEVCLMDINRNSRITITNGSDIYGSIPTFSPNGNKIAYAEWSGINGNFTQPQIVIYDLVTKRKQQITNDTKEYWRPVFSPDSKSIAYIAKEKGGNFDIYIHDLTNNSSSKVTSTIYEEWDPMFSHDGNCLVYAGNKDGNWDLFIKDFKKQSTKQITKTIGDEWDPSFTHDDKQVLYGGVFGLFNGIYRMPIK